MKKYFIFGLIVSLVSVACFAQHPRITQLIAEKQAKMEKLEKCQGTTKKLKIAGISTLGVTAVGVGANIAEAVILKDKESKIATAKEELTKQQEQKDKRECEKDSTKMWQNGECVAKVKENEVEGTGVRNKVVTSAITEKQCKDIHSGAKLNGGKCLYTVNEKIDESKIGATIQGINRNCVKGDWLEGNKFNAKCGEVDFIIDFAGDIKCSVNKEFTGGKCDNQKTDTEKADADKEFNNACNKLTGKKAEEKGTNGNKELSCFASNITVAGKDEAIAKAKEKISSCTDHAEDTGGVWFAVYCGKGALDHRVYVKKQVKDPASGVDKEADKRKAADARAESGSELVEQEHKEETKDKEAEKRMADFKKVCKEPWRLELLDDSVNCVIGDVETPASRSDVESKLKEAFNNSFCDNNGWDIKSLKNVSVVCCIMGRNACNAFVYRYSTLTDAGAEEKIKAEEVENTKCESPKYMYNNECVSSSDILEKYCVGSEAIPTSYGKLRCEINLSKERYADADKGIERAKKWNSSIPEIVNCRSIIHDIGDDVVVCEVGKVEFQFTFDALNAKPQKGETQQVTGLSSAQKDIAKQLCTESKLHAAGSGYYYCDLNEAECQQLNNNDKGLHATYTELGHGYGTHCWVY